MKVIDMSKQETKYIIVSGNSMAPILRSGEIFLLSPPTINYSVGEILVYKKREKMIIHRLIINNNNSIFITKGDNNPFWDKPIRKSNIIGTVIASKRPEPALVARYSYLIATMNRTYGLCDFTLLTKNIFTKWIESYDKR